MLNKTKDKIFFLIIATILISIIIIFIFRFLQIRQGEIFIKSDKKHKELIIDTILKLKDEKYSFLINDYTIWDEFVDFINTGDKKWAEKNVDILFNSINIKYLWVYDRGKKLVYSNMANNKHKMHNLNFSEEDFYKLSQEKFCHYYIFNDHELLEVIGAAIHAADDHDKIKKYSGFLFFAKELDDVYIKELVSITNFGIKINYDPLNIPDIEKNKSYDIKIVKPLFDYSNNRVADLIFTTEDTFIKDVTRMSDYLLFIFAVFALILLFMAIYFPNVWIYFPLKTISDSLKKENPDSLSKLTVTNSDFGEIALSIQRFFVQKEQLEELFTAIEHCSIIILIINKNFTIKYFNPYFYKITGYSADDADSLCLDDIILTGEISFNERIQSVISGGFWEDEIRVKKKNGGILWMNSSLAPVKNDKNDIVGFVSAMTDITERKKSDDKIKEYTLQLKDLNATKDKLFSIIAHDLKNPFVTMIGLSEMLILDIENANINDVKKIVSVINSSAKDAHKLLENLLEWSRAQTGNLKFQPAIIDIKVLLIEVVSLLKAFANNKKIKIKFDLEKSYFVFADKNMISTVLRNLITNAVKFTKESGTVGISCREIDNQCEIVVSDNGIGIDESAIKMLFEINHANSTNGTAGESGTGLGLILCKEFIEINKGEIFVRSKPGVGSDFIFTLPKN
jgi:two-component system, sensor histidine kinase and response regulator